MRDTKFETISPTKIKRRDNRHALSLSFIHEKTSFQMLIELINRIL